MLYTPYYEGLFLKKVNFDNIKNHLEIFIGIVVIKSNIVLDYIFLLQGDGVKGFIWHFPPYNQGSEPYKQLHNIRPTVLPFCELDILYILVGGSLSNDEMYNYDFAY